MSRAFDDRRPPSKELIDDCVHCGFCLPTCPTYVLWGEEMDSPRGRIVLMDEGLAEGSAMTPEVTAHFDRCLGCMACVTACPSGVQYDRLIEAVRPQVERNAPRSVAERLIPTILFALFTHPARLRATLPALRAYRASGLAPLARRALGRWPRLAALERLTPPAPGRNGAPPLLTRAVGPRRGIAGVLQGCVQRVFFGDVNAATIRVLAAEGFDVIAPRTPRCCGALQMHAGREAAARGRAKETIQALGGCDVVVANAAGCGSAMKDYVHLLDDEPGWAGRAEAFSGRVRDISEVLAGVEPVAPRAPMPVRVAYHDACHLAHAQGIREEPRRLLRSIPELELLEPAEWEICCGSAGVYNLLQPNGAAELGRRKAANLVATGAEIIAAGNPGCALQIGAFTGLPIRHPIELLDDSIRRAAR